ncbi:MAG: hemolysin family protein [Anaerolineae bacterium]
MSNSATEIVIIVLLLIANGVFSMSEIAVVAARKIRLQQLAETGNKQAATALELAKSPNQFLATVQVGITLIGILAGAFGGATIAENLETFLNTVPLLAPYSTLISVAIVVMIITYLSLIIGELVPKRLALNNPERIASMISLPMQLLSKIASPIVRLLDISTDIVIRILGVKPSNEPPITLEEIKVLIEQGTASGIFEETEQDMIENVLRLDERPVNAWMTPRTQIIWLDIEAPAEDIRQMVISHPYSHFPVAKGNIDNIVGVVRAKDLLVQILNSKSLTLEALMQLPLFIPESLSALDVLEAFKKKGTHLAVVTDEYGGVEGLITHNDILTAITGHISTATEPTIQQRKDGSWLVDGLFDIEELKEILDIEYLPDEDYKRYHTVGGLMMSQINGIPFAGQSFEYHNLRFEVIDMDERRVDKVLIMPIP